VAVKEYLVWLDQSGALGAPFVLREVDDEHLFVVADRPNLFQTLQEYLDAWHDVRHSSKYNTQQAHERNAVRVCFWLLRLCVTVPVRCCSPLLPSPSLCALSVRPSVCSFVLPQANSFSAAQQQAVTAAQQQASQAHLPPAAQRQRQGE
jgi:hypothetical protein